MMGFMTLPESEEPDPAAVASRASGRPPEEESSEDPERQAEVILEDSEERTIEGSDKSESPGSAGSPGS
jgi:hypothetical protein